MINVATDVKRRGEDSADNCRKFDGGKFLPLFARQPFCRRPARHTQQNKHARRIKREICFFARAENQKYKGNCRDH